MQVPCVHQARRQPVVCRGVRPGPSTARAWLAELISSREAGGKGGDGGERRGVEGGGEWE